MYTRVKTPAAPRRQFTPEQIAALKRNMEAESIGYTANSIGRFAPGHWMNRHGTRPLDKLARELQQLADDSRDDARMEQ